MIAGTARAPGRLGIWVLGARPPTLVAALVPVAVGAASVGRHAVSAPRTVLAVIVALGLQVAVNYANDYFDGTRGVDTSARLGPPRLVAMGMASPRSVAAATVCAVLVAAAAGIALALLTSPWLLAVGLAAILALILYSGGPSPYGSHGLGEAAVFLFFGVVATVGTAYVQEQTVAVASWLAAVSVGLIACLLLMVNNIRDIPTDLAAGKRTVAVRLGDRRSRVLLVVTAALALFVPIVGAASGSMPALAALSAVTGLVAIRPLRLALSARGRALVPVLIGISRFDLAFAAVLSTAFLVS